VMVTNISGHCHFNKYIEDQKTWQRNTTQIQSVM